MKPKLVADAGFEKPILDPNLSDGLRFNWPIKM